ncbi:MAG: type II CAAX endopeptidase family protein [Bacteroidota bacterium]
MMLAINFSYLAAKVIFILKMNDDNSQYSVIKNRYNDDDPVLKVMVLGLIIFVSMMVGVGLIAGCGYITNMDMSTIMGSLSEESQIEERNFIRTNLMINHLTTFIFPALVFTIFFYKSQWTRVLRIDKFPNIINVILGTLLISAAFPLAQFAYWLNLQVPLPDYFVSMEESTADMIRSLLLVEQSYELWFNLFIIAVLPGIGEELIFRGILQKKLVNRLQNPHLGIWIAAFIFSAIHMQFQGFLSRMLLGGILGYLFHWTGNLWVPIIAHIFNNAFQILGQYFYQKGMVEINLDEITVDINWGVTLIALLLVMGLSWLMIKLNPKANASTDQASMALDDQNTILDDLR